MVSLKEKRLFLLDMDGTLYIDNDLFPGVPDFLSYVRAIGGRAMYLTNNSSKSVSAYIDKLQKLGIQADTEDFVTSLNATVPYLKAGKYRKIYGLGTASFRRQLLEQSLPVVDTLSDDIDCLCMGFDTELTFQKLEDACILLGRGVEYIATNPDWVCPTAFGSVPDCGSVAEMLYRATGRRPRFIGKPQPDMVEVAVQRAGFSKEQTILLGDRLYTDICCGVNGGIDTVLVLSGEATLSDLAVSETKPTYVMDDIQQFYQKIKE